MNTVELNLEENQPLNFNEEITEYENISFFSCICFKNIFIYHLFLAFAMTLSICLAIYTEGIWFIVLSAIIPGAITMDFCRFHYNKYITRCQMTVTAIETVVIMNFIVLLTKYIESQLLGDNFIYNLIIKSFILAGFMEELTKLLPLLRIINYKYITNPRALWVYGLCAGAGFACFENIFYVLMGGLQVAIVRSVLSVPLHCCTGLITGINLSKYKFEDNLEEEGIYKIKYIKSILIPIFIHGLFDFLLLLGDYFSYSMFLMLSVIELLLVYIYIRYLIVKYEKLFPRTESIHSMIKENRLEPPCIWFIH